LRQAARRETRSAEWRALRVRAQAPKPRQEAPTAARHPCHAPRKRAFARSDRRPRGDPARRNLTGKS